MADVQIAIIDQQNTQIALAAPSETQVTAAVPGVQGPKGEGVPAGGTVNQVLFKQSGTNYDTAWSAITSAMIGDLQIVDADISASAAIADTKLATISTAGKVSNSATTAASANTASAIVARDASGNFSAGTITAGLTGAASSNVLKAGDTMTGALATPLGAAATPSLTFTGDLNTGIYSPGADQVAISTNGTGRLFVGSTGTVELTSSLLLQNTSSALNIKNAAGTARNVLFQDSSDNLYFGCTDGPIIFRTGTGSQVERMRLDSSGGFQFKGAGTAGVTQAVSFNGSAPVNSLVIDSSGRLGLGTSSPSSLLSLSGSSAYVAQNSGRALAGIDLQATAGGSGLFGGAVSFGAGGTGRAAIAAIQGTTDNDVVGLGFFGHASGTAAADAVEYMRIDGSTGNVGIGTTNSGVAYLLDVAGAARFSGGSGYVSFGNNGYIRTDAANELRFQGGTSGTSFWKSGLSSESVRIDNSGRLLVGTSTSRGTPASISAEARLQLEGGDNNTSAFSITNTLNGASSRGPNIRTARIRGTGSVVLDDTLGLWATYGHDGSDFIEAANIRAQVDGTPGTNDMPGRLVFSTTADGASSPTERLRITSAGLVGIGSDSPQARLTVYQSSTGEYMRVGTTDSTGARSLSFSSYTAGGTSGVGHEINARNALGEIRFSTGSTERLSITSAGVLKVADAGNIEVGTTTGTKIGTATTQKLGFYNKTPVVQPTAVADATDAASVITQLNALLSRMRDLGLIAT